MYHGESVPQMMTKVEKKTTSIPFDWYYALQGTNLFPCHKRVKNDPRSKTPLESGFYNRKSARETLEDQHDDGHGLGCSLGHHYFTMDVDAPTDQRPDKKGLESLDRLIADTGLDLEFVPCVESPSGGKHYYFKKPPQIKIRKVLKEYPGIEFITGNNYVLIAGSPHWQGGNYEFSDDTQLLGLTPEDAPVALLDLLIKTPKPGGHQQISCEDLELLLKLIDPNSLTCYADRLELAMACHSATGGAGLAEFTNFILENGGNQFSTAEQVQSHWDSFDPNEDGGITVRTLIFRASAAGDQMPGGADKDAVFDTIARVKASLAFNDADWGDDWDIDPEAPELPAEAAESCPPVTVTAKTAITVTPDEDEVTDKVTRALGSRAPGLFIRDGLLVELIENSEPRGLIERPENSPILEKVVRPRLRLLISKNCRMRKDGKDVHVADWLPGSVEANRPWHGIRPLTAVIEAPVIRADGSILSTPGYDLQTGLLLTGESCNVKVAESPGRQDAVDAAKRLLDVFSDFPYGGDSDRAGLLSAILTGLSIHSHDSPTPLHLFDANRRGSGKTKQAQSVCHLLLNREPGMASYTQNREEMRKVLMSLAVCGDSVVCFDNVTGAFGDPSLDAALTSTKCKDRLLGGNRIAELSLRPVWMATGNNVSLRGDLARRVVPIRLVSPEEFPERRSGFKHPNLKQFILRERGNLLSDALTILRAFYLAGLPRQSDVWAGSFEGWDTWVRQAILWLGYPDPLTRQEEMESQADAKTDSLKVLMDAWPKLTAGVGRSWLKVKDVIRGAQSKGFVDNGSLWDALASLCKGNSPDPFRLSAAMREFEDRVVGGRKFVRGPVEDNTTTWAIENVS